jgi:glycine/D-amino acid oxidase-like deaminating enzyme
MGQGLAGSLLAWHLMQAGQRVLVVDNAHKSSASAVAAGIVNPVTGKRLVKSWNVDVCLPEAWECYGELAREFGREFYHELPLLRLFKSTGEIDQWNKRSRDPVYGDYLGERFESGQSDRPVNAPLGGFWQLRTGYLDMKSLLAALKTYFQWQGSYVCAEVAYDQIKVHSGAVQWGEYSASRLVFCEGYRALANPWFSYLPLQPAKGSILTVHLSEAAPDAILNAGPWVLPLAQDRIKVGATYHWEQLEAPCPEEDQRQLIGALKEMLSLKQSCELIEHACGVRPGTRDRRPLVGRHPDIPQLGVFNGFGAKGAMLIPYYALRFTKHLIEGADIPAEVDIRRVGTPS